MPLTCPFNRYILRTIDPETDLPAIRHGDPPEEDYACSNRFSVFDNLYCAIGLV